MATLCMNAANPLPKTTFPDTILKPRKNILKINLSRIAAARQAKSCQDLSILNHLLPPTNLVGGDFSTTLLPPNALNQKTVVLDLDETLIHSTIFRRDSSIPITPPVNYDFVVTFGGQVAYVKKRPFVDEFLQYLHEKNFEIVIFTAGTKEYASPVLDRLDPNGLISHRLYRGSRKLVDGKYVKDLSNLGRDLKNVVIVDDKSRSYELQPENGIPIKRFIDDAQDDELKKLMDRLFKSCDQYENLKDALKRYWDLNFKLRIKYCKQKLSINTLHELRSYKRTLKHD